MAKLYEQDFALEHQSRAAAERVRDAKTDEERAEGTKALRDVVAEHFKLRQQRRELELKRLAETLEGLRSSIRRRSEQEREIIDERVKELLGPQKPSGF